MISFWPAVNNGFMYNRLNRAQRVVPVILGAVTLADVLVLFTWDAFPAMFPVGSHDVLAASSLALIAVAYLMYQLAHRPAHGEFLKATMLAVAFLFWAANQFWPNLRQATVLNDIAIALFVLDVFLVMVGWPSTLQDESFAETITESMAQKKACDCACCCGVSKTVHS
jgi:hypothetical protein